MTLTGMVAVQAGHCGGDVWYGGLGTSRWVGRMGQAGSFDGSGQNVSDIVL
jgi:hypothetical protein